MMTQYRNVALGELSPHVYAIAEQVSLQSKCPVAQAYHTGCWDTAHISHWSVQ